MTPAEIAERIASIRAEITRLCEHHGRDPATVELLAVSKTRPATAVRAAIAAGQLAFGENKVQELIAKAAELAAQAQPAGEPSWDMIGSLQTNKVRDLVHKLRGELRYIHSLDRIKLADTLERQLADLSEARCQRVLVQIDATGEDRKHGATVEEVDGLVDHVRAACPHLRLAGCMAMGPLDGDPAPVFGRVADLRARLEDRIGEALPVLSLGMTGDLEAAIAAGSTMVRIGTGIFGPRS